MISQLGLLGIFLGQNLVVYLAMKIAILGKLVLCYLCTQSGIHIAHQFRT